MTEHTGDQPAVPWWDPSLGAGSDTLRTASYRRLQSLWRETVLNLPPAPRAGGGPVGNMLPEDAPANAQWLTAHISSFAQRRLDEQHPGDAAIEPHRLQRNLLSSMPLCFNVFGQLCAFPAAAARVLSALLALDIDALTEVRVEYAPDTARAALGDATAFDAFIAYTTSTGEPGFLAIETKYTEPFSPTQYQATTYETTTDAAGSWFKTGSAGTAAAPATNQLWRNTMLAQLTESLYPDRGSGCVVVLTAAHDEHARAAAAGLAGLLLQPDRRLRHARLEDLVTHAAAEPELSTWAALFKARYLTPIPATETPG